MNEISQAEVDGVVGRVKALVKAYGGDNPVLDNVRRLYGIFQRRPEHAAFTFLVCEIEKVEKLAAAQLGKTP